MRFADPRVVCFLIDYFNVGRIHKGRPTTFKDHLEAMEGLQSSLEEWALSEFSGDLEIVYRLYGGWFDAAGDITEYRSILRGVIGKVFPYRRRRHRAKAEFADFSIYQEGYSFPETLRTEVGLPYFKVQDEPQRICKMRDCHIVHLIEWRRNRCPNYVSCKIRTEDVVALHKQKLIDTLLVADFCSAFYSTTDIVCMISNDDDMMPALFACQDSRRAYLVRIGRKNASPYDELVSSLNLNLVDLQVS